MRRDLQGQVFAHADRGCVPGAASFGRFRHVGCDASISSVLRDADLYAQNVVCRQNQAKIWQDRESGSSTSFATVKVVR